ncbi:putative phage-like protein YoqJ [Scopulibacillus darangshiensis]|uniref:Putative phage-like protein YoqJ n=1 Tax=Scopulibacillus darangshiensis TaxID=442528 RepID=A0A4R2PC83_9BACL|nr:DUF1273 domain-containing protein [Scopulibacillus darangshiensis]TCP31535.1 putative phage-like protein YoqJ [Scopulibacillus darangshiensis]
MNQTRVFAVTGYKPNELGIFSVKHPGIEIIKHTLRSRIIQLIQEGVEWFLVSGQPGVELWAAEVLLQLKNEDYPAKLGVLMPFLEQEARWPEPVKQSYYDVLAKADFVEAITKRPYEHPAQLRQKNDFIVRKADGLLVIYDEESPGSPEYFLGPARRKAEHSDFTIITINRFDIDLAAQEVMEQDPDYWAHP